MFYSNVERLIFTYEKKVLHFITIGRTIHYQALGVPFLFPQESTKQIIHRHLLLNNPTMLAIRNAVCSDHRQMHGLTGGQGTL